jgi:hypothetical protein
MIATAVKHIDGFLDTPKSYQERKAMDERILAIRKRKWVEISG